MDGDFSRAAAATALRAVYGFIDHETELIEIGLKRSSETGYGWQSVFTGLDDLISGGLTFVQTMSRDGADVYIGACTIKGGPPERGRGNASVRGRAGALWVDLDCQAPGREGDRYFRDVPHAWGVLEAVLDRVGLSGAADVVVNSGYGVQAWIRLSEPVDARVASRWTRALISEIKNGPECDGKMQIDRVWDVTRVLRFPGAGTYNWRAGNDDGDERPVSVLRLPAAEAPGVSLDKVIAALSAGDAAEQASFVSTIGMTYGPLAGGTSGIYINVDTGKPDARVYDLEAIFDQVPWSAILVPFQWTKVGGHDTPGTKGEMEVWLRPGKTPHGSPGLRSAVVYGDAPNILVVHSDSAETGLPGWWETRSLGGREEGGQRRANTKWRTFVRLRAQRVGALDSAGAEDEDVAEHRVRADALDIARGSGRVEDYSGWPEIVITTLREDGAIERSWIDKYQAASVTGMMDTVDEESWAWGLVAE